MNYLYTIIAFDSPEAVVKLIEGHGLTAEELLDRQWPTIINIEADSEDEAYEKGSKSVIRNFYQVIAVDEVDQQQEVLRQSMLKTLHDQRNFFERLK